MNKATHLSERARTKWRVARRMVFDKIGVIAIKRNSKAPDPRFCPNGSHDATLDLDLIRDWLIEDDRINLAAVMLETSYLVVDVDGPKGAKAAQNLGPLPKTFTVKTRNGTHRYYRHCGKVTGSKIKLASDLDIIASGYVLLPDSDHPDGGKYEALDLNQNIVNLPQRTIDAINRGTDTKPDRKKNEGRGNTNRLTKGKRNNSLASIAGSLRRRGYDEEVIFTVLDTFNQNYCKPPLRESEVEGIAGGMMRYPAEHEDLFQLMTDVTPRDVEFLWKPYFVRGAVNLLEGDSNVGKTYFLCWLAAVASSGLALPGGDVLEPQKVLFLSAEDDPETTLVKRMMRMGADLTRIWVMKKFLRLDEDALQLIEKHVAETGVSVILLDPLLAYMQSGIDMNKANETRPFMARLAELAKEHNLTIIALRHLNKSTDKKAIHRGLGSVDITAASRSAIMIGLHPEDDEIRVFAHAKHNLSARGDSLLYTLEGETEHKVPKLIWDGTTDLTAEDLTPKPNKVGRPPDAGPEAEQFLRRALAGGGARPVKDVVRDGERRSINASTLRKVARKIGVIKKGRTWKLAETPT